MATLPSDANFMKIASGSEAFGGGVNLFSAGVTVDYAGLARNSFGAFDIGGFRLPGARLAAPLLTVLGDRAMRNFAEHPDLQG